MATSSTLHEWLKLRELSPQELKAKLAITDAHIVTNGAYENLSPITQWHNPAAHPGYFIFQGERLALIYIGNAALKSFTRADLQKELGPADAELRSRAGKVPRLYFHADKGIAYSADKETVHFLEIFPPMPLAEYKAKIYKEPPPFRK